MSSMRGDVPVWRTWAAGPQLVVTCNTRDAPGEQAAAGGHKLLLQKDQKNHASQQTLRRHVVTAWVIYCTL